MSVSYQGAKLDIFSEKNIISEMFFNTLHAEEI